MRPETNRELRRVLGFGLVGVSNTVVSYVVFVLLTRLGLHYFAANACGFVAGAINSYLWNSRLVFKTAGEGQRQGMLTFARSTVAGVVSNVLVGGATLGLLINGLGVSELVAPIVNLAVTFPVNYLLCRLWAYRVKDE